MAASGQRRCDPRSPRLVCVRWVNRENEGQAAEIFDVSASGFFMVPTGAFPESVGVGDSVWVVVQQPDGDKTLTGTVRWRGYSQIHDAIGCGVLLDPGCLALAATIFALCCV
jgi:hypothetical protein